MAAPQFEQPQLRTSHFGGGSSYQHPITGKQVPSVTTISGLIDKSSFLTKWAVKLVAEWCAEPGNLETLLPLSPEARIEVIKAENEKLRSAGRDLGSLAHNTIEQLMDDPKSPIPPEVSYQVGGWIEWMGKFVQAIEHVETTVWSHRFEYAGTLDAIVLLKDGRRCLIDYKTGKDVHADAALQLTALKNADVIVTTDGEFAMPEIHATAVLHLPAPVMTPTGRVSVRGKWSHRYTCHCDECWQTFLSLRRAYAWEKGHSKDAIGGKLTTPPTK